MFVPKFLCNEDIKLYICDKSTTDVNGLPEVIGVYELKGRVSHKEKSEWTGESRKVRSNTTIYIFDGIEDVPDLIVGFVEYQLGRYDIVSGIKYKNPDGTANHISLELMM